MTLSTSKPRVSKRRRKTSKKSSTKKQSKTKGGKMSAPTTFHNFEGLPPDLRTDIWKLAVMPRIVEVRWDNQHSEAFFCKPQGIVSACYESHQISIATPPGYSITIKGRTPQDKDKAHPFDYDHDLLYLSYHKSGGGSGAWAIVEFLSRVEPKDLARIKRIAVNVDIEPSAYADLAVSAFKRYGRTMKLNLREWITVQKDKLPIIHTKRIYDKEGYFVQPDMTQFVSAFRAVTGIHNHNNIGVIPPNFGTPAPTLTLVTAIRQRYSESYHLSTAWGSATNTQQLIAPAVEPTQPGPLQKEVAALTANHGWNTHPHPAPYHGTPSNALSGHNA
ncbi:hypothetical protein F5884DRAFT_751585 [Xylogone sp. PMI_703]|nr:hypothetical protein F5884DRAFT_751585 [Xylogone sp. PMI_703]